MIVEGTINNKSALIDPELGTFALLPARYRLIEVAGPKGIVGVTDLETLKGWPLAWQRVMTGDAYSLNIASGRGMMFGDRRYGPQRTGGTV